MNGYDINPVAVQLSRLSLWIHTFVPGLPLSFLDHSIVCGNALVGIATLAEAAELVGFDADNLFSNETEALLGQARDAIKRLAKLSDANAADIRKARRAFEDEKKAIEPTREMFDILTASRLPEAGIHVDAQQFKPDSQLFTAGLHRKAIEALADAHPFHFPIAFPEVFLRDRAGFDVIVGNPPWEEATLEQDDFWARYTPGIQALPQHEQETLKRKYREDRPDLVSQYEKELAEVNAFRRVLVTGPYPGIGTGDPDLYKAFCWRFWHLISREGGRIGVVLPRSALAAKGSKEFRLAAFSEASAEITFLINNRLWVFEDGHPQWTYALTCLTKRAADEYYISLRGPFAGLDRFRAGIGLPSVTFPASEVQGWTDTAALPLLPAEGSAELFAQLRKAPRLDLNEESQWRARPHTELHATNDKGLMELVEKKPRGYWPVLKGESFDIWDPDTGSYYAWANPKTMQEHLEKKRQRGRTHSRSVFFEFAAQPEWFTDPSNLPCLRARIAFRDVSRATDTRTIRVALLPPKVFLTNKAPYFVWPRGDQKDQAFLLGVLSSIPFDWYARRFVELSVNFFILNPFPVPRPTRDNPLWQRVVQLAGRLASPDERFAEWAEAVGVECGPIPQPEKEEMSAELDAVVAHLYGLTADHVRHIFETFHENWDYAARLTSTLRYYRDWERR